MKLTLIGWMFLVWYIYHRRDRPTSTVATQTCAPTAAAATQTTNIDDYVVIRHYV
mgnify:CR=1 FL=1